MLPGVGQTPRSSGEAWGRFSLGLRRDAPCRHPATSPPASDCAAVPACRQPLVWAFVTPALEDRSVALLGQTHLVVRPTGVPNTFSPVAFPLRGGEAKYCLAASLELGVAAGFDLAYETGVCWASLGQGALLVYKSARADPSLPHVPCRAVRLPAVRWLLRTGGQPRGPEFPGLPWLNH